MKVYVAPHVDEALRQGRPVVALESAVITHGLPRPVNLETARAVEKRVRAEGAMPATVAVEAGRAIAGAADDLLERLASTDGATKVSLRDIAPMLALGRPSLGGTTVAATVAIAAAAGIRVMATGGIGGVHRGAERTSDVSADLDAIARSPVCVVCSGAKLILDLSRTLEVLETLGVPVVGFGTDELPAFYVRSSRLRLAHRVEDAVEAARIASVQLGRGAGMILAVPVPEERALARDEAEHEVERAVDAAEREGVGGAALTPYLLKALGETTQGRALAANVALLENNAAVASAVARELVAIR